MPPLFLPVADLSCALLSQEMQDFYTTLHQQEGTNVTPNLPPHYPTSVLLGCVDVVSCRTVSQAAAAALCVHDHTQTHQQQLDLCMHAAHRQKKWKVGLHCQIQLSKK